MDVSQRVRELIITHHLNGLSCRSIASMVNVPKSTVIRLVKRYKDSGLVQTTRLGNCGRPRIASQREERTLARESLLNPVMTARELRTSVGGNIAQASISTVKRILRRQGRLAYRPRLCPSLNSAQRQRRLKWCRDHRHVTAEQWKRVSEISFFCRNSYILLCQTIFSDETYVDVCGNQAPFVRRSPGEPIRISHTVQHRPFLQRVMFWGAICGEGTVALVPINGTMTANKYVDTLNENLVSFLDEQPLAVHYVFQHDNAPSHKARLTIDFLRENHIALLKDWPPYSPDLNIIENMWAFVKRKLRRENIETMDQLTAKMLEIWNSQETNDLCRRLAESMPRRIALCIKNKGGFVKY